jgi:iron complex transport system ATP-binding protein
MSAPEAIRVQDVRFRYADGEKGWVLDGISLAAAPGEVMGLLGPNGSGKSTLLRVISGVLHPEAGSVALGGQPIGALSRKETARTVAMVVPEGGRDLPFRVEDLVLLGRSPYLGDLEWEGPADRRIAREAMARAGVDHLAGRYFDELSLGERQRVLLAQGLAQEPKVLLLDEPVAHLDIHHQVEIHALLEQLARERGVTVLAVSHDLNLAAEYCDRLAVLSAGRVRAVGTPEAVITADLLREVHASQVLVDSNPASGAPRVTLLRS